MSGKTPKAQIRESLHAKYRKRGHKNENLWVVYSVKTNSDWILQSDRQLIHWISFLETDRDVAIFDLAPEPLSCEFEGKKKHVSLDAIATLRDGKTQWHEITSGTSDVVTERSRLIAGKASQVCPSVDKVVTIGQERIAECAEIACRWLKPISFAAGIRGREMNACRNDLVALCNSMKSGTVSRICNELSGYEPSEIAGILVRVAIEGCITLNLESRPFGLQTQWSLINA